MEKYLDVDIISILEKIVNENTQFYRTDFDKDKIILRKTAEKVGKQPEIILWMSRRCGTWALKEKEVFLRDTWSYCVWRFYKDEPTENVKAYLVELTGIEDDQVRGNVYSLDYNKHVSFLEKRAVEIGHIETVYEKGAKSVFDGDPALHDPELGELLYMFSQPKDDFALNHCLEESKAYRRAVKENKKTTHFFSI